MSETPRHGDEITTSEGPRRGGTAPRVQPEDARNAPVPGASPEAQRSGVGGEVTQSERDVAARERQRTELRQSGTPSEPASSTDAPVSRAAQQQQELFKADFASMREHINALRNHAMTLPNSDALAEVLLAVESAEQGIARAERLVLNLQDDDTTDSEVTP